MNVDRKHFQEMMQFKEYPDTYPILKKTEAMKKCATAFTDVEDLGDIFKKTPLYEYTQILMNTFLSRRSIHIPQ